MAQGSPARIYKKFTMIHSAIETNARDFRTSLYVTLPASISPRQPALTVIAPNNGQACDFP
jgi:hypothetical protein